MTLKIEPSQIVALTKSPISISQSQTPFDNIINQYEKQLQL